MTNNPALSLNIVCETPLRNDLNGLASGKKTKKNRYDRRREHSKKAKLEKAKLNEIKSGQVNVRTHVIANTNEESDTVTQANPALDLQTIVQKPVDDLTTPETLVTASISSPQQAQLESKSTAVVAVPPPTPQPPVSSTVLATSAPSRKNRHVSLDDEKERAKYMAEYHARPLEMDRRYGASREKMKGSVDSSHIFDSDSSPLQGLHHRLWKTLTTKFSVQQPTLIQSEVWKLSTSSKGKNLFVQSETGSGKTLAYLLPIVQHLALDPATKEPLQKDRQKLGTRCVILCPTRELASQTFETVDCLLRNSFGWLVAGCLSGGEKRKSEKQKLRKGITILVATPGRFLDHIQKTESLLLSLKGKLEFLVLDEADRLLDMGLGSQIEQIVQHVRANQPKSGPNKDGITWSSMMVSATVTTKLQELARCLLGGQIWSWAQATPQKSDFDQSTPQQLRQLHLTVNAKLRLTTLIAFLVQRVKLRSVVFMSTCDGVDYHYELLRRMECILPADGNEVGGGIFGPDCPIFRLHGSVPHSERQSILKQFNACKTGILLATDVAARGLNLKKVDWTVQYDPPCEVADYAHRAGRAARAGKAGHSMLFLLPSERKFLDVLELKGLTRMSAMSLATTLNEAAGICSDLTSLSKSGHRNKGEAFCAELQKRLEDIVMKEEYEKEENKSRFLSKKRKGAKKEENELLELARKAFLAYVRSYPAKEKLVRSIFVPRSLHMGHIARSFALKEAPKMCARSVDKKEEEEEDEWGGKRKFEFKKVSTAGESEPKGKRARKSKDSSKSSGFATNEAGTLRQVLIDRAKKLQRGGMDSF